MISPARCPDSTTRCGGRTFAWKPIDSSLSLEERAHKAVEYQAAICGAEDLLGSALGVRHESEDIEGLVGDSGDVVRRAVWVALRTDSALRIGVTEENPVL